MLRDDYSGPFAPDVTLADFSRQALAHLGREDVPNRVEAVRQRWQEMEAEFATSAYPLAVEARQMFDAGDRSGAEQRLSTYMADNVDMMMSAAEDLIARFSTASVAAG